LARSALAANDAQAVKLREAAIYQDYLATDFASAEKKLVDALALCAKPDDCTAATRARLHCDLGVVYFASQKIDEARAQFAAALKEDPNVGIDADLLTPELSKELAAAKSGEPPPAPKAGPGEAAAGGDTGEEAGEGQEAPAPRASSRPTEATDCPPGFPGCNGVPMSCNNDDDCTTGERCVDQKCTSRSDNGASKSNWVSLAAQVDDLLLPGQKAACSGGKGYSCFNPNGTWYGGTPTTETGVPGGFAVGSLRIVASYDRVFGNFTLGAAAGVALRNGPRRPGGPASLPVHAELRGKYWVGRSPFAKPGFKFYFIVGGGLAEVDASIGTYVSDSTSQNQPKTAWRKTGTGFATAGFGLGGLITKSFGIFLEPRFMQMFPTTGEVGSGQILLSYGL